MDAAEDLDAYEAETLEEHLQRHAATDANNSHPKTDDNEYDSEVQELNVL
jgi:NAD-dependent DNA ligase